MYFQRQQGTICAAAAGIKRTINNNLEVPPHVRRISYEELFTQGAAKVMGSPVVPPHVLGMSCDSDVDEPAVKEEEESGASDEVYHSNG